MQTKFEIMLQLQDDMNSKVHSDWRDQGFPWFRAIWIESAEMLDHYGWKWWKKQDPDVDQVILELIDIWHFGLSILILEQKSPQSLMDEALKEWNEAKNLQTFPDELEKFVAAILHTKGFDLPGFARLMKSIGLDFETLYTRYVGKNVLNFFRQDNGYKDGSYRKLWAGREDNEHLVELSGALDTTAPEFKDHLYEALSKRYKETI
ncbi:MAG: dUTP diphosphatase [Cellvibrionaceae bacterium]